MVESRDYPGLPGCGPPHLWGGGAKGAGGDTALSGALARSILGSPSVGFADTFP
jgi:hypothetical protein